MKTTSMSARRLCAATAPLILAAAARAQVVESPTAAPPASREWRVTGGDPGTSRYSPLAQIDAGNVKRLEVAWTYRTGDVSPNDQSQIQATPIVVRGVLYATTPGLGVFALDAATGREKWKTDLVEGAPSGYFVNRGVVYWEEGAEKRLFVPAGARLWALDPETGRPVREWGDSGSILLARGLGRDSSSASGTRTGPAAAASVIATSPGVIYRDLLIQGTRVGEGDGAAPGHVRAFDVRTGKVRWIFHTIPEPGDFGYDTWPPDAWKTIGGANSWPGMSVDVARGIVYVPTGSPAPDFYGGARHGANLYGNTLLALDAATGKRRWHFQTIHHDLWDRDLPAAPNLLTVSHGGRRIDAAAQITKHGYVFLFDRATGKPLFPVVERAAPASTVPGERAFPTQPHPTKPAPFARQRMTAADVTDISPASRDSVMRRFRTLRSGGLWDPPSREGTVVLPGFDGGGEWGGSAVDLESGVMYVNGSDVPWIAEMIPAAGMAARAGTTGKSVYDYACATCHGANRRGDGSRVPSLAGVHRRLTTEQMKEIVDRGRGFMPGFQNTLAEAQRSAVVAYLAGRTTPAAPAAPRREGDDTTRERAAGPTATAANPRRAPDPNASPFRLRNYERFRDPDGYPAIKPPWGTLNAIDLNTGEYRWRIVLGEHPALTAKGIAPTGTEQYGGPIVTAGGLVFIAATMDEKIRAFDKRTGALLWESKLPAAGFATPATYEANGKQYVVIAAGGGKLGLKSGDAYVAFALP